MSELVLRLTGDATVRGATTYDAKQVFSVYDSMALFCGKNEAYARTLLSRLISAKSEYKEELEELVFAVSFCSSKKRSPYETPAMTLRGLQRLVQILGGKVAADFRVILEATFTRYMSGDLSMVEEIRTNAASSVPVHQAYRQTLEQEPVTNTAYPILTRDEALFNLELHERHMALHERHMALHERSWALYEKSLAFQRRK
jgi:hypothetical protein